MSTWHPVAVNITTNQSDSTFKVGPHSSRKKRVSGNRTGNLVVNELDKKARITIEPNWHYQLCVAAYYMPTWMPEPTSYEPLCLRIFVIGAVWTLYKKAVHWASNYDFVPFPSPPISKTCVISRKLCRTTQMLWSHSEAGAATVHSDWAAPVLRPLIFMQQYLGLSPFIWNQLYIR